MYGTNWVCNNFWLVSLITLLDPDSVQESASSEAITCVKRRITTSESDMSLKKMKLTHEEGANI